MRYLPLRVVSLFAMNCSTACLCTILILYVSCSPSLQCPIWKWLYWRSFSKGHQPVVSGSSGRTSFQYVSIEPHFIDVHPCCMSNSWSRKAFFDSLLMAMVARLRSTSPAVKAQAAAYLHARVNRGWTKFGVGEIRWDDMERQVFEEISPC